MAGEKEAKDLLDNKQIEVYRRGSQGRLKAQVSSFEKGLEEIDDICIIRINNKKNNLMIMEDYLPIIGKINGNLSFIRKEDHISYENVRGFFVHEHNVFSLLLRKD